MSGEIIALMMGTARKKAHFTPTFHFIAIHDPYGVPQTERASMI